MSVNVGENQDRTAVSILSALVQSTFPHYYRYLKSKTIKMSLLQLWHHQNKTEDRFKYVWQAHHCIFGYIIFNCCGVFKPLQGQKK